MYRHSARNYDANANVRMMVHVFPEENFDCDGDCIVDLDCFGDCGGDAMLMNVVIVFIQRK